ncbi:hypothetical protein GBAR_LOCUS8495, partial [Geodia barretti]
MNLLVSVLCVLVFAGTPIACFECVEGEYNTRLTPESKIADEGETVKLTCSTDLPATYSRWEIDDQVYESNHLPPGFTANGFDIEFVFGGRVVDFRCFFKIFSEGSDMNICSSLSRITPRNARDGDETPSCLTPRVSFLNRGDIANIYMGFQEVKNRSISVNYRKRSDFNCTTERITPVNETEIDVTLSPLAKFYNNDVIVTITDDEDEDDCGGTSFEIPNMQPTGYNFIEVNNNTDDLSNQYCDIGRMYNRTVSFSVIEHKMCIYSRNRRVTECFDSLCNEQDTICADENKLLVQNETENETVVSIFCTNTQNCTGNNSDFMVYNNEIILIHDDGQESTPPQPRELFLSMDCNVPVSDGRPGVFSWMDGERDDGVEYPGEQKAVVKLSPPGDTVCSDVADTRCTFNITTEDYYTVSLTLTNDAGSSEPVSLSFNTMVFQLIEDNLGGNEPNIRVTVNEYCSNTNVTVSFGERENGSNNNCDHQDFQSDILAPDAAMTFY